jgi:hypothetical protein
VLSCKCIELVCDALTECESFKRLLSSQCSRTNAGISAKLPRNSAYTGIRCAGRSGIWRLTSAPYAQRESVDHHNQRLLCCRYGDGRRSYIPTLSVHRRSHLREVFRASKPVASRADSWFLDGDLKTYKCALPQSSTRRMPRILI